MINKWIPYVFLFTYMMFTLMTYIFKFTCVGPLGLGLSFYVITVVVEV